MLPQRCQLPLTHIQPVNQHPAGAHVIRPVNQLGDATLARPRLAHNGHRLARQGLETDPPQHVYPIHIAKGHILKANVAADRSLVTGGVLVQRCLHIHQLQDAPRAGHPQRNLRIGEQRDKRGKAEQTQQPHVAHNVAHANAPRLEQQNGMGKADSLGNTQHEQGQETRLNVTPLHRGIAVFAGILIE